MLACRIWIYSFIGHISTASNASTTDEHSHHSYQYFPSDIYDLLRTTWWWNSSRTFNIASVTNQLSLQYSNTVWNTAL